MKKDKKSQRGTRRTHTLAQVWLEAQRDLGIKVQIPFQVVSPEGNEHAVLGLVECFGSPKGTLLISLEDDNQALTGLLESLGYAWSAMNPRSYTEYDRERFIDLLNDWRWYGSEQDRLKWSLER